MSYLDCSTAVQYGQIYYEIGIINYYKERCDYCKDNPETVVSSRPAVVAVYFYHVEYSEPDTQDEVDAGVHDNLCEVVTFERVKYIDKFRHPKR